MNDLYTKYIAYTTIGLMIYFSPIVGDLLFVGFLVIVDWITGLLKGAKTNTFSSHLAIKKFWVSVGYLFGILVVRAIEVHYNMNNLIVKPVVAIITISELQSLRENFQTLTGTDILKPVINLFKKK
jgi:phage-related holin